MITPSRLAFASLVASSLACHSSPRDTPAPAPVNPALAAAIDSIVRTDVLSRGITGVSLVIARNGQTLLERSWGYADAEAKRAVDAATTYRSGSIAKQFTATLVLKQVDRGRVALTDTIGQYLTGLKPAWRGATIEQLLNHTSGVPRDFRDQNRIGEIMTPDSLMALASRSAAPVVPPGTKFMYSNTGYMLLAVLAEKLYGKPYGAAIRDEIAVPLGLTSLSWCGDRDATARGYMRTKDGGVIPAPFMHPTLMLGNGGICTTAGDLAKWNRALHGGRVLSTATYAAMTTPHGVAAKASVPYGLGLYVRETSDGAKVVVHDGSTVGYNGENVWYPAHSLSITMLYNSSPSLGADLNLTERMGAIVLGQPAPAAK